MCSSHIHSNPFSLGRDTVGALLNNIWPSSGTEEDLHYLYGGTCVRFPVEVSDYFPIINVNIHMTEDPTPCTENTITIPSKEVTFDWEPMAVYF